MTTTERPDHRLARVRGPRARLADAVRSRVAGPRGAEHHERIWNTEGERWFSASDPIWRVHADAAMFVGGIRALLLQSLHPVAMQAVSEHSGFRSDPWGRLQRTSLYLATTTYGRITDAERTIAAVAAIHERVTGTTPEGRPYAAADPDLLLWIHLAEADSFLTTHQRYSRTPLTAAEADTYVAQLGSVAARLGTPDPPTTVAALDTALESYRPLLRWSPAADEAAALLLRRPALPIAAWPGYAMLAGGAVATLPAWARAELRLPTFPVTDRLVAQPVAAAALGAIRWAMTG